MKCPYQQLEMLQQALASDKSKIAFFIGAGCPVAIRREDGQPLIPDIKGLTEIICKKLNPASVETIKSRLATGADGNETIESLLSHIRLLIDVIGSGEIDGFNKQQLEGLEKQICDEVAISVKQELPSIETPYHQLASWIQSVHRNDSVEIFTSNYDLLIESALESRRIPYFDGFIGSKNAFFDLHAIEQEKLPPRWVKLWKLHGSINWWSDKDHNIVRNSQDNSVADKRMIFPSHLKYDQSRRMPYLAMQDQLGTFLATGQAILITIGYSFKDQHLNSILMQRLSANPRAICFGLLYGDMDNYKEAIHCAKRQTNISLLADNGIFSGGQRKKWDKKDVTETDKKGLDFCVEHHKGTDGVEPSVKCKIGDFNIFGQFLLNQVGISEQTDTGKK